MDTSDYSRVSLELWLQIVGNPTCGILLHSIDIRVLKLQSTQGCLQRICSTMSFPVTKLCKTEPLQSWTVSHLFPLSSQPWQGLKLMRLQLYPLFPSPSTIDLAQGWHQQTHIPSSCVPMKSATRFGASVEPAQERGGREGSAVSVVGIHGTIVSHVLLAGSASMSGVVPMIRLQTNECATLNTRRTDKEQHRSQNQITTYH